VLAALAALLRHWLPEGVVEPPESNVSNPQLEGHPVLLGGQLVVAALYASAAVGFARRGEHRRDEFLAWFAIACVLAAFSRINYFLFPSLYSDWVYVGDVFRLLFYVVLLAAALREIGGYWESIRTAAALDERRQIAHDVHDGLAQELAYLERAVHLLDDPSTARDARERVEAAVGRAQTESRRLIHALTTRIDEPVEAVLTRVTAEAADRWGVGLELDLAEGLHANGARRDALLRIAVEAVTNVGKHSGARSARVELAAAGSRVRLIVSDDGRGLPAKDLQRAVTRFWRGHDGGTGTGLGLAIAGEIAAGHGGTISVEHAPEGGLLVRYSLPATEDST
jgi:signal transduction histidine kinase